MKTTLNKIRSHSPCEDGWKKLLTFLGKSKADDEELSILTVLDSNGFYDALWCLSAVDGYDKEIRLFAVWCARQVEHLMTDPRSKQVLDVAEAYANGQATDEQLSAARAAASASAYAARGARSPGAARDAASDAARAAAYAAAYAASAAAYAATYAASAAASAAAYAARGARAAAAARAAARTAQETKLREILA